ncbi:ATP-dependent DNA helicase [Cupriavidus sp. AU9028]|nr:ATP-dependent DNA helicase [Cupriavidus sp. AU9028]
MPPRYTVAVRTLCEFSGRSGDLDLRFSPSPTAQEGIAGHAAVAARRGPGYQTEVALTADFLALRVRGRADGLDRSARLLEEIKTVRGDKTEVPDAQQRLHRAQAETYGWMLCQQEAWDSIEIAVVYFDVLSGRERSTRRRYAADELREAFEQHCRRFLQWAEQEIAHRAARDHAITALSFPHAGFRPGQRVLAEAVYRANLAGRCLMAQAPTGIGKTAGTMFPALKAMPARQIDKLFVLSARSTGRALAAEAMDRIGEAAGRLPLRVLEMVAREKVCEYPGRACHPDDCPLAQGFHDRLPAARQQAVAQGRLGRAAVREVARTHGICPYYLSQELVRWSDVVIADYHYYFDRSALLYAMTAHEDWRVSVLVDEAHQLVDRGRAMYTAALEQDTLRAVRRRAPAELRRALDRVRRQWNDAVRDQQQDYQAFDTVPPALVAALDQLSAALLERFSESPAELDPVLQQFYFDVLQFCRLAEQPGPHAMFDITRVPPSDGAGKRGKPKVTTRLCMRNVFPAPFLRPRFAAAHSVTLFSATLGPAHFYVDTLGLPEDVVWCDVPSPFQADQLQVRIADRIPTRYAQRQRSLPALVALLQAQYRAAPGNYLAFFSSHAYLQEVLGAFQAAHPDIACWAQSRGMSEADQAAFLDAFRPGGCGIGFAVLGGAFGEGVDLPGDRLVGAFVATLGLPQFNAVNEQLRARMQQAFGDGYAYTYLYPGLRKVVQAAGRVIRTTEDRGVLHLIDDRFARPEVLELLPDWWRIDRPARVEPARPDCAPNAKLLAAL